MTRSENMELVEALERLRERCAALDAAIAALDAPAEVPPSPYNRKRIAWELERTAMGDGYYGNALYAAKELPEATPRVRSLLDRWATGKESGLSDCTDLCAFALQIYAADGESPITPLSAPQPPAGMASIPESSPNGWLQTGGLLYRLTEGHRPQNRDEINVTMVHGSRDPAHCEARAAEILSMLQSQPPAGAQARPAKPAECADGCPALTVCDHCQWPPGPDAEAQPCGCGEATCTVPWEPGCGLGKSEQHVVVEAAPPSAPVGVEVKVLARDVHYAIRDAGLAPESPADDAAMRDAILRTLAQQPAADGGFTAADMMDARQEGRKEAQQPAAVDGAMVMLAKSARELQRKNYGSGAGLHLDMIDWAREFDALAAQPGGSDNDH